MLQEQIMTMVVPTGDVRALLNGLYLELSAEYDEAIAAMADIGRRADIDGDEIDAGAKTALREHQLSLIASIDERRVQVERALERMDLGTYGQCETCHKPISRERLEAFPAATSCVSCKQAHERRG
jgi:DnaK suppressor protein